VTEPYSLLARSGLARSASCVVLALTLNCAGSQSDALLKEQRAAERAYSHGRYQEAATHWAEVERLADEPRDVEEARYRKARALLRAGRTREAKRELAALSQQGDERRARARYDLARVRISDGDLTGGYRDLERLIADEPDAAITRSAIRRLSVYLQETTSPGEAARALAALGVRVTGTRAAEDVLYYEARAEHRAGNLARALHRYEALATRYPYPKGAFWDDACWYAAEIEVSLGHPKRAVERLEELIASRESAYLQGSYERGRFAQARYRIAELYRDELNDPLLAAREFHRLWDDHPSSLLRDDALWQAALLEHARGDRDSVCRSLEALKKGRPESRYLSCGPLLCPAFEVRGECRAYIRRTLNASRGPEDASPRPRGVSKPE
jgi:tetratricopeptide (TPR) repeat protein